MLEVLLRPTLQRYLIDPVAQQLVKFPLICSPLLITILAALFGILSGISFAFNFPYCGVGFLLLSGYADILDGSMARLLKSDSALGAVMDIMADRLTEASVLIGLFFYTGSQYAWVFLFMLAASYLCITSFLVVAIFTTSQNNNKSFHYSSGLIERAEAFLFFIALAMFPQKTVFLGMAYTILVLYTAVKRLYSASFIMR